MGKRIDCQFDLDTYDSHFFKTKIAKLKVSSRAYGKSFYSGLPCALELAKSKKFRHLLIRLHHPKPSLERFILMLGFKLCTQGVNFELKTKRALRSTREPRAYAIRLCRPAEVKAASEIARKSFGLSFLYLCGFAKASQVDRYHMVWVRNLLKDKNVRVFVAVRNKTIAGFLAFKVQKEERRASIVLVAVDKKFRGQGVASALLHSCCEYGRRACDTITVRTQKNNLPAIALYRKHGFKLTYRDMDFYRKLT